MIEGSAGQDDLEIVLNEVEQVLAEREAKLRAVEQQIAELEASLSNTGSTKFVGSVSRAQAVQAHRNLLKEELAQNKELRAEMLLGVKRARERKGEVMDEIGKRQKE